MSELAFCNPDTARAAGARGCVEGGRVVWLQNQNSGLRNCVCVSLNTKAWTFQNLPVGKELLRVCQVIWNK